MITQELLDQAIAHAPMKEVRNRFHTSKLARGHYKPAYRLEPPDVPLPDAALGGGTIFRRRGNRRG